MIVILRSLNEAVKQNVHAVVAALGQVYDLAYEWAGLIFLVLFVWFVIAVAISMWR